jgi:hypothetical protein
LAGMAFIIKTDFDYAQPDRRVKRTAIVFQRNIFTEKINGRVKPITECEFA